MKILHITPSYKPAYIYGGPIESVSRLCEALQQNGHAIRVLTTTANGKDELPVTPNLEILVEGVPVIYFSRWTKGNTHSSPALWRYLYQHVHEYDVVHIHSWWNVLVIVATMICHARGTKVVLSPRGMLSDYILHNSHGLAKKWIHRLAGKKALRKTVFHATAASEQAECTRLIPGWTGFLVPNLLQLPAWPPERSVNELFTFIYLSRIHPKKGIELLLEAVSRLSVPVRIQIAGEGDAGYVAELKHKVTLLGLDEKITWLGWQNRDDKFNALAQADAFVLTSYNENFANTVIESLSVGTPVLISEGVGLANYVKSHQLGWITELTVEAITATIQEAVADTVRQRAVRNNGPRQIRTDFSQAALVTQYELHYHRLLTSAVEVIR